MKSEVVWTTIPVSLFANKNSGYNLLILMTNKVLIVSFVIFLHIYNPARRYVRAKSLIKTFSSENNPIFSYFFNAFANTHHSLNEAQTIKSYLFFEKLQNERLKKTLKGCVKAKRITKTKYLHSTLENEKKNCSERLFYQYFVENQFFWVSKESYCKQRTHLSVSSQSENKIESENWNYE